MGENTTKTSVGCTAPSGLVLLTVAFFVMRAMGYIDWSWWLVFSPLWGPWALLLVVAAIALAGFGIVVFVSWLYEKSGLSTWRQKCWRQKMFAKQQRRLG